MSFVVTDYDWNRNTLFVSGNAVPSRIRFHKDDSRKREVYTARVYEYVPRHLLEDAEQRVEEYDNYIKWLCNFVPQDRWDEVYDQITAMGIDYIGADDV